MKRAAKWSLQRGKKGGDPCASPLTFKGVFDQDLVAWGLGIILFMLGFGVDGLFSRFPLIRGLG